MLESLESRVLLDALTPLQGAAALLASPVVSSPVGITPTTTTLSLAGTSSTFAAGASVTVMLSLTAGGVGVGGETVTVFNADNGLPVRSYTTNGSGLVSFIATAPPGDYAMRADFTGDATYVASSSNILNFTIAKDTPAIAFTFANLPSDAIDATVSNSIGITPTGSVTLNVDGAAFATTTLAGGHATFHTAGLGGRHTYSVAYAGDSSTQAGASAGVSHDLPVLTTTTVQTNAIAAPYGQSGQVTITVAPTGASAAGTMPEGTVTLFTDIAQVGTASLSNGVAVIAVPALYASQTLQFHATYTPTSFHAASVSATIPYTIYRNPEPTAPTVIDVLALYTADAQTAAGGHDALALQIVRSVNATTGVLGNSGLAVAVRLVGIAQENYTESGDLGTDLDRLTNPSDGYMDNVATLRALFGADVVLLFDSHGSASAGSIEEGIAWEFDPKSPTNSRYAFAVIDQSAPLSDYVVPHEIGHLLGAAHAVGDPGGGGATAYAHGYRFTGNDGVLYHDVMAYDPGQALPFFSNPYINYQGVPTGNAKTANAARTVAQFAPTVAGYLPARGPGQIDSTAGGVISGWVFDPNDLSRSMSVRVDIDGVVRGIVSGAGARADLAPYLGSANHGFAYLLPALATGNHTVSVYTLDPNNGNCVLVGTRVISIPSPPLFDEAFYLATNPDIAAAVRSGAIASGWVHFNLYGQYEGRNPSMYFNQAYYLAQNPDVAAALNAGLIKSAFQHFLVYGQREGRKASVNFSEAYYLARYPDIAAAVASGALRSGLEHYILYGQFEGRRPLA